MGSTTSLTKDNPALPKSLVLRLCVEALGERDPSFRMLPTNSEDNLRDPAGSTFLIGRIVSTPVPRSPALRTVPVPSVEMRAAYEARREERTEPEYAGGAPKNNSVTKPA